MLCSNQFSRGQVASAINSGGPTFSRAAAAWVWGKTPLPIRTCRLGVQGRIGRRPSLHLFPY
jgi:hypothetical protein